VFVFEQGGKFPRRCRAGGFLKYFVRDPYRGHPDFVAGFDPAVGAAAPFVDAHLATADDAVHMGFGHALEVTHQKVVQALPGRLFVHHQPFHGRRQNARLAPYNVFHWLLAVSG